MTILGGLPWVVIDQTLSSVELWPNFLAIPSQFGFWQRMTELFNFKKKLMFFPLYLLWIFPLNNLFSRKSGCKFIFIFQMCVLWLIPNDKTKYQKINAKKLQSSVQFCSFWQRVSKKFSSVGFWQCSSSVDH